MLHTLVSVRCILDGELAVLVSGKPDFSQIQRRSLITNPHRMEVSSKQYLGFFTAFDILHHEDEAVIHLPLMERKALLQKAVQTGSGQFTIFRLVKKRGAAFFSG